MLQVLVLPPQPSGVRARMTSRETQRGAGAQSAAVTMGFNGPAVTTRSATSRTSTNYRTKKLVRFSINQSSHWFFIGFFTGFSLVFH